MSDNMVDNKMDKVGFWDNLLTRRLILPKSIIVASLVFSFLCSGIITFNAYCAEGNNTNPYCSGDQDRIQELTEEFIRKYGEEVTIRWNEATGTPRRIYDIYYDTSSKVDIGNAKGIALSFLSENSSFVGINIGDH